MLVSIGVPALTPAVEDDALDDLYVDVLIPEQTTLEGAPAISVEEGDILSLTQTEDVVVGELLYSSAEAPADIEREQPARLIPPPTCYIDLSGASIDPTVFPTRARVDILIPVQTPTVSGEVRCSVRRDISDAMVVMWDEVGLQVSAEDFRPTHAQKVEIYRKATQMAAYFTK